jgi:hypothetical protein
VIEAASARISLFVENRLDVRGCPVNTWYDHDGAAAGIGEQRQAETVGNRAEGVGRSRHVRDLVPDLVVAQSLQLPG